MIIFLVFIFLFAFITQVVDPILSACENYFISLDITL